MQCGLLQSCDRLHEAVLSIDVTSDIHKIIEQRGHAACQPEQVLPDFYVRIRP